MKIEHKEYALEIKKSADDSLYIEGYVGAFGNVDSHGDVLMKGAVSEQIGETVNACYQHGTSIGAMKILEEDDYGIKVSMRLMPDDIMTGDSKGLSDRLRWQMDNGIQYKMSIGYIVKDAERYSIPEDLKIKGCTRLLKKVQLIEGSVLTVPSNNRAIVTGYKGINLLSADVFEKMDVRDLEEALTNGLPMSASMAKKISNLAKEVKQETKQPVQDFSAILDLAKQMKQIAAQV
jgi:uncharacterized protein